MIRYPALIVPILMASLSAPAVGQVEPLSPVHITVNAVFFLCPKLVRTGTAPNSAELAKLGFTVTDPQRAGELWFKGQGNRGLLYASYDSSKRECFINYAGKGYEAIAGVVRDTVMKNGFTRITGGDKDGAKADVFEGRVPNLPLRSRVIIIENYTQPSATIRYTERPES